MDVPQQFFRSEFFTSKDGDIIFITSYVPEERENLIKMYEDFSPEKRCCGLPPTRRELIEGWIDDVSKKGYMFIAKHARRVIGHIVVVPQGEKAEFAVFVHQDYEGRWIGQELIRFAESFLRDFGVKKLEAITERENVHAIQLYKHIGFKVVNSDAFYLYLEKEI
ncbi:MAG: GNAT family N-acetyltransferase [Archaeoglobus sp.]|nr:GNAT family N-acetyltransferase [Archaeoglobus sp.]